MNETESQWVTGDTTSGQVSGSSQSPLQVGELGAWVPTASWLFWVSGKPLSCQKENDLFALQELKLGEQRGREVAGCRLGGQQSILAVMAPERGGPKGRGSARRKNPEQGSSG
jgi:hypothetical protein